MESKRKRRGAEVGVQKGRFTQDLTCRDVVLQQTYSKFSCSCMVWQIVHCRRVPPAVHSSIKNSKEKLEKFCTPKIIRK